MKQGYNYTASVTAPPKDLQWPELIEINQETKFAIVNKMICGNVTIPMDETLTKSGSRMRKKQKQFFSA